MLKNLLSLARISAGMALLLLGIIGLFLPILQGWLLIFLAIPLISPEQGKKMMEKVRKWKEKGMNLWNERKRNKVQSSNFKPMPKVKDQI